MLCGVVVGSGWEEAIEQLQIVEAWADLVELRVDLFEDVSWLPRLRERASLPVVLTWRGGTLEDYHYLESLEPEYLDIEHTLGDFRPSGISVIRSYHDFEKTPENLDEILVRLQEEPADHFKIATWAHSTVDALRMLRFVQKNGVIGMAMGPLGAVTRILGPVVGAPMTYAAAKEDRLSASGQLTGEELVTTYRFHELSQKTELYGLIGDPVDKSISHKTHNRFFQRLAHDAVYVKMLVSSNELSTFLPLAHQVGFRGLSVTMPLKEKIDERSVNTLKWEQENYTSCSTDGEGALDALSMSIKGKKVTLLGAGGAARSIAEAIVGAGGEVVILNRTLSKAKKMAEEYGCRAASLDQFSEVSLEGYDLLINATSVGMKDSMSPIPVEALIPHVPVMEVIATPVETPLVKEAKKRHCPIIYGKEIFRHQAKHQFVWWLASTHQREAIHAALAD